MVDDALRVMEAAAESMLDPSFSEDLIRIERQRERLRRENAS